MRGHPPAKPALPSLPAGLLRPNALRWRARLRGKLPAATQTCAGAVATAGACPLPADPRSPQTSGGFGGFSGFSGNFSRKTGGSRAAGRAGGALRRPRAATPADAATDPPPGASERGVGERALPLRRKIAPTSLGNKSRVTGSRFPSISN